MVAQTGKMWLIRKGILNFPTLYMGVYCTLVRPFWIKVLEVRGRWFATAIPLTAMLRLLRDRFRIPIVSKSAFSVILVGMITANRINLSHSKKAIAPDWGDIVETASSGSMISTLKSSKDGTSSREFFGPI